MSDINFTVDRIVENIAVLLTDDEQVFEKNIAEIPFELCEGDVLTGEIDGTLELNVKEKEVRTERINSLFEKLKNRGNKP